MIQLLALPWPKPPLSLNDRQHWAAKATIAREIKQTVTLLARGRLKPIEGRANVCLHWRPDVKRRRDLDNVFATLKPILDACVSAGVLRDDSAELVTPSVRIHPVVKGQPAAMWLEISEDNS